MPIRARIVIGEDTPEPHSHWTTLPDPIWEGQEEIRTGENLTAIFYQRRAKRWVIETYSIWENRNSRPKGQVIGLRYFVRSDEEINSLFSNLGL